MTAAEVCPAVHGKITKFLPRVLDALDEGLGLFFFGGPGIGKTSAASLIMQTAKSWGATCYFTSVPDLKSDIKGDIMFDETQTVLSRVKQVECLVLDELAEEDILDRGYTFSGRHLEDLIRNRYANCRMTIITTNMTNGVIGNDKLESFRNSIDSFVKILFEGENRRKPRAKSNDNKFFE